MFRIHGNYMYRLHKYSPSLGTLLATSNMLMTGAPSFALVTLWSFLPITKLYALCPAETEHFPTVGFKGGNSNTRSTVTILDPLILIRTSLLLPSARKLPLFCPEVLAVADMQPPHLAGETLAASGS